MVFPSRSDLLARRVPWFVQAVGAVAVILFLFGMQAMPRETSNDTLGQSLRSVDAVLLATAQQDGEQIYNTRCMSCHQMEGRGVPGTFPPLTNTEWVTGDKGRLIRLLLHGVSGPMEVQGTTYSGTMPPWGGALDDEGIAAIATYIRTSWGNDASEVTADEVARVRAATEGRKKPWTAKELEDEANQGIPGDEETD